MPNNQNSGIGSFILEIKKSVKNGIGGMKYRCVIMIL
jgi:hypothetical protein